jgi:hypothetical protein
VRPRRRRWRWRRVVVPGRARRQPRVRRVGREEHHPRRRGVLLGGGQPSAFGACAPRHERVAHAYLPPDASKAEVCAASLAFSEWAGGPCRQRKTYTPMCVWRRRCVTARGRKKNQMPSGAQDLSQQQQVAVVRAAPKGDHMERGCCKSPTSNFFSMASRHRV